MRSSELLKIVLHVPNNLETKNLLVLLVRVTCEQKCATLDIYQLLENEWKHRKKMFSGEEVWAEGADFSGEHKLKYILKKIMLS